MSKEKPTCDHCGAKMVEYTHSLNTGILTALVLLYDTAGRGPLSVSTLELTHSQQANFQKLGYWGLIEPVVTGENRDKRGWWRVSDFGRDFIVGARACYEKVVTYRGQPRRKAGRLVRISDVIESYDYRAHYSDTATPAGEGSQPGLPL